MLSNSSKYVDDGDCIDPNLLHLASSALDSQFSAGNDTFLPASQRLLSSLSQMDVDILEHYGQDETGDMHRMSGDDYEHEAEVRPYEVTTAQHHHHHLLLCLSAWLR